MSLGLFGLLSMLGPEIRPERVQEVAAAVDVFGVEALVEPTEVQGLVDHSEISAVLSVTEISAEVDTTEEIEGDTE